MPQTRHLGARIPPREAARTDALRLTQLGKTGGAASREMITFVIGVQHLCVDLTLAREICV